MVGKSWLQVTLVFVPSSSDTLTYFCIEMDRLCADNVQLRNTIKSLESIINTTRVCVSRDDTDEVLLRETLNEGIDTARRGLLQNRFGMFRTDGPVNFFDTTRP
jgi:hypothetical protein